MLALATSLSFVILKLHLADDKWAQFKPSAPCAFAIAPDGKTSLIDLSDELADPLELSGPDVGIWTRYKWPQDWN